jgi:hypothetical protein
VRLVALAAGPELGFDLLAFLEVLGAAARDRRRVQEHVVAVGSLDEAEPLATVEPLDTTY